MESILTTSKKKITTSIIGMVLSGFGIAISAFYDQQIGIVIFSMCLGFLLILFLIRFLQSIEEAKYQKEFLDRKRSEIREQSRHLKFIFKYNFLLTGTALSLNAGMIIWGIIDASTSSIIVFSIFFGISLCSSMIIYLRGKEAVNA